MAEEKKNALIRFWEAIEKAGDNIKIARAAKSLQRQAEIDVAKAQDVMEEARMKFEKAKIDAKESNDFKSIVDKFMDLKIANKKFDDSLDVYIELFEEEPKLLAK